MVYGDAEKLYAEVRTDTETLVDRALAVLYPSSLPLSSASTSGPLTVFAHNTTPFARRDVVRVPLGERGLSSGNILLQKTSDGKEGYVVLEGGAGGGLVLPSQISAKDLNGTQTLRATIARLLLTFARGLLLRCHGT
jgi:alpha-mannosidase